MAKGVARAEIHVWHLPKRLFGVLLLFQSSGKRASHLLGTVCIEYAAYALFLFGLFFQIASNFGSPWPCIRSQTSLCYGQSDWASKGLSPLFLFLFSGARCKLNIYPLHLCMIVFFNICLHLPCHTWILWVSFDDNWYNWSWFQVGSPPYHKQKIKKPMQNADSWNLVCQKSSHFDIHSIT